MTCGVHQGSVLGPVLFLLYAASVINLVEECGFCAHAYADDLQVYQHASLAQSSELLEQMAVGELRLPSRSLDGQQPTAP